MTRISGLMSEIATSLSIECEFANVFNVFRESCTLNLDEVARILDDLLHQNLLLIRPPYAQFP